MKTIISKDFDAVKFMRKTRDEISKDIAEMDYKRIKQYLAKKRNNKRIIPGKSQFTAIE